MALPIGSLATTNSASQNNGLQMGPNNGPVLNFFFPGWRLLGMASGNRDGPFTKIHFTKDLDFVQRGDILDRIAECLKPEATRAALVGLGGAGKTQLAVEYAYQVRRRSKNHIFWIDGATRARFEDSYRVVAQHLKLVSENGQGDALRSLLRWLQDPAKGQWVIILDNADDIRLFHPNHLESKTLDEYLPQVHHGRILITSRNKEVAKWLVEKHQNIIHVGPMSEEESIKLFHSKRRPKDDDPHVAELVGLLGHIPLAITQAASFIEGQESLGSVKEYIKRYKSSEKNRQILLKKSKHDPRRYKYDDAQTANSIATTLEISFKYIEDTRFSAARLLSLMSQFQSGPILMFVLRTASESWTKHTDDPDRFTSDIVYLLDFSLVNHSSGADWLDIHPLVHSLLRGWLQQMGHAENWATCFFSAIDKAIPRTTSTMSWHDIQSLSPHLELIRTQKPSTPTQQMIWSNALRKIGEVALLKKQYDFAEANFKASWLVIAKVSMSHYHRVPAVHSLAGYAHALRQQNKDNELVNSITEKIHTICNGLLQHDPEAVRWDTLHCLRLRTKQLILLGNHRAAEAVAQQSLRFHESARGKDDPWTLDTLSQISDIRFNQGQYKESAKISREVVLGRERAQGTDHLETLHSKRVLTLRLADLGHRHLDEAENVATKAMQTSTAAHGKNHAATLTALAALARVNWAQEKLDSSKKRYMEAIKGMKRTLGAEHPETQFIEWEFQSMKNDHFARDFANRVHASKTWYWNFAREYAAKPFGGFGPGTNWRPASRSPLQTMFETMYRRTNGYRKENFQRRTTKRNGVSNHISQGPQ